MMFLLFSLNISKNARRRFFKSNILALTGQAKWVSLGKFASFFTPLLILAHISFWASGYLLPYILFDLANSVPLFMRYFYYALVNNYRPAQYKTWPNETLCDSLATLSPRVMVVSSLFLQLMSPRGLGHTFFTALVIRASRGKNIFFLPPRQTQQSFLMAATHFDHMKAVALMINFCSPQGISSGHVNCES